MILTAICEDFGFVTQSAVIGEWGVLGVGSSRRIAWESPGRGRKRRWRLPRWCKDFFGRVDVTVASSECSVQWQW